MRQGSTSPAPLPLDSTPAQYFILTQSLHLKYTCGKRAVFKSSSLYTLFLFCRVVYNSVGIPPMSYSQVSLPPFLTGFPRSGFQSSRISGKINIGIGPSTYFSLMVITNNYFLCVQEGIYLQDVET